MRGLCCSLLALAALASLSRAVVFTRCQLYRELLNRGFPRSQLRDWVCLVEAESARNTAALGTVNPDGSRDYGLFQINNRYWCGTWGGSQGSCRVACNKLLDNNIDDDCKCARFIFGRQGFDAWVGWKNRCKNKPLPDLSGCSSAFQSAAEEDIILE